MPPTEQRKIMQDLFKDIIIFGTYNTPGNESLGLSCCDGNQQSGQKLISQLTTDELFMLGLEHLHEVDPANRREWVLRKKLELTHLKLAISKQSIQIGPKKSQRVLKNRLILLETRIKATIERTNFSVTKTLEPKAAKKRNTKALIVKFNKYKKKLRTVYSDNWAISLDAIDKRTLFLACPPPIKIV